MVPILGIPVLLTPSKQDGLHSGLYDVIQGLLMIRCKFLQNFQSNPLTYY